MAIRYETPRTQLIQSFNALNPQLEEPLDPAWVDFSDPSVTGSNGTTNTQATLYIAEDNDLYKGELQIRYQRLDLNSLFGNLPKRIPVRTPQTSGDIATALGRYYYHPITAADVLDTVLDNSNVVILKAHPESLGFHGEVSIRYDVVD